MSAITRRPLAVEMLLTTDQRRLHEATATSLPLPASMIEDCNACRRKLGLPEIIDIPIDPPNKRSAKEIGRVLSILDSLERGIDR